MKRLASQITIRSFLIPEVSLFQAEGFTQHAYRRCRHSHARIHYPPLFTYLSQHWLSTGSRRSSLLCHGR